MTIRDLIKDLQRYDDKDQPCAYDLWLADDVRQQAQDENLTTGQCADVLSMVQHNKDAGIGINWDVLQYWIDETLAVS